MRALPNDSTAARLLARLEAMPGLKIRDRGQGRYKLNSPLRPTSDSGDFTLTIRDGEHGAFYDGPAEKSGSLYELAQQLGVEPGHKPAEATSSKRAYSGLADYAQAHGCPAETFIDAGWREDHAGGRSRLQFDTASGPRWRFIDGEKPTYLHGSGYQSCWYGLKRAIDMARRRNGAIVLCNGEASVVAGQYHGVAAACVTSGGERPLPDAMLAELRAAWDGPVIVALDCDQKGKEAAPKLAAQLRGVGYGASAVNLGGSNGFDLADFCTLYEAESYAVLCELATSARPKGKIIHASDLKRLAPPEWLERGWIVKRGLNVIYGAPGTGKSTRVLDWCCKLSQRCKVLYVAAEDAGGYAPRYDGWCQFFKQDAPGLMFWPEEVNALDATNVDAFIQEVKPLGVELVVFDTLTRCIPGGSDADAVSMGLFIAMCDRVRRECGAAALAVHHTGKNGEYRGHSSLLGAADMFVRFEDKDDLKITAVEKAKNSAPVEPLKERFVEVETTLQDSEAGRPITTVVLVPDTQVDPVQGRKLTTNQMRVMETLCLRIFEGRGVTALALAEATALAKSSLYHTLSVLRKKGYIEYVSAKSSNLQPSHEGRGAFMRQYRGASPSPDSASNSASPIVQAESNVDSNLIPSLAESNSLPTRPLKGARGIGQLDEGIEMRESELDSNDESKIESWNEARDPALGRVDLAYIVTLLRSNNPEAIKRHCAMHRGQYNVVLAAAQGLIEQGQSAADKVSMALAAGQEPGAIEPNSRHHTTHR